MKTLYNFRLTTPESRNKNRLTKIHRLKKENRVLSDRRKCCYRDIKAWFSTHGNTGNKMAILWINRVEKLSEQIGKNSCKIQRLRTLIQQEKARKLERLSIN